MSTPSIRRRHTTDHVPQNRGDTTIVLILGRSGCGKTYFSTTACTGQGNPVGDSPTQATNQVKTSHVTIRGARFKLIDTPGFDNPSMSNLEAFGRLADYLLVRHRVRNLISGIVYIHRAGDPVNSRALAQNLGVLFDTILGNSGLSRLIILSVSKSGSGNASAGTLSRAGIFHPALNRGAEIIDAKLNQANIHIILENCAHQGGVRLRVQEEGILNPKLEIRDQTQEKLGYYEPSSVKANVDRQVENRLIAHKQQITSFRESLQERNSEILQLSRSLDEMTRRLGTETSGLNHQLDAANSKGAQTAHTTEAYNEAREEIGRLRIANKEQEDKISELSQAFQRPRQLLADNQGEAHEVRHELQKIQQTITLTSPVSGQNISRESRVIQEFKKLNRDLDDTSCVISAYLVDEHVRPIFGRDPSDVTTLDAFELSNLKKVAGHVDGKPSLAESQGGAGMPIEDFLDHMTRTLLCKHLCNTIFFPFHPALRSSQNDIVSRMYRDVRQREPQAAAAEWRVNSFRSIDKTESPSSTTDHIEKIIRDFEIQVFVPLLTFLFGKNVRITFEKQHLDRMTHLFQAAWRWNLASKMDPLVLDDFQPTYYRPLDRFKPSRMNEFQYGLRQTRSSDILGTLAMGLNSSRAVGGEKEPEVSVVLKATVAMDSLYA